MKIATWNVNGIRARGSQVAEWLTREKPDIFCLQEIKASADQIPSLILNFTGYSCYWHGGKGYSGVAMLVRRDARDGRPDFFHPHFDYETRIVTSRIGGVVVASIYVPNGGKDFEAKMRFLGELVNEAASFRRAGAPIVFCGDLNVARAEIDVHPKERRPLTIGQRPEERGLFEKLLEQGLADVGRLTDPNNAGLFTWWAPWRNMRQRNIGWRLDYILASRSVADRVTSCRVDTAFGTSDHAPVVAEFDLPCLQTAG
jgi:exodeoxyribonuclease-3